MKAFKGCVNYECEAYKKTHYKDKDYYCLKCGSPLTYVCSVCWKPMSDNSTNKCISCEAKNEQNIAQKVAWVKDNGAAVVGAVGVVAKGINQLKRDGKVINNAVNDAKDVAKNVYKVGKAAVAAVNKIKK